jgi:hypothetical protein
VLLRSRELKRQGDHPPNVSFRPTRSNMDALQADASAIPDDSVDHVANALVTMQVTAPAAATVPASTPVDPADRSAAAAAAVRAQDTAATRRPGIPRRRGRPPSRQARLCRKIGSASPTHVLDTIACFRDVLQQIVLPIRGRPPPHASSSSGLSQRTKLFFRSKTLALQCVPGTGRTVWTSAGTTRMFCLS